MNRFSLLIVCGAAVGLAGCADVSPPAPTTAAEASGSMPTTYAYPLSVTTPYVRYGYHPLPYDNTGNSPGVLGLEGGGG